MMRTGVEDSEHNSYNTHFMEVNKLTNGTP